MTRRRNANGVALHVSLVRTCDDGLTVFRGTEEEEFVPTGCPMSGNGREQKKCRLRRGIAACFRDYRERCLKKTDPSCPTAARRVLRNRNGWRLRSTRMGCFFTNIITTSAWKIHEYLSHKLRPLSAK